MLPKEIELFTRYDKKPNNIKHGFLYQCLFDTPLPKQRKRIVRVFLPFDYFEKTNKKYSVMYMSDGQNLVDKYLSAYGEWNIDEHNYQMMKKGYDGLIYVGFDCPNDEDTRFYEMVPENFICSEKQSENQDFYYCGSLYLDCIFKIIKPVIDQTFRTIPDRDHTIFGGSSMGGLISFYAGFYYQSLVSKVLCYSPAFSLANQTNLRKFYKELVNKYGTNIKIALLSGGKEFEKIFIKPTAFTYLELLRLGFKEEQLDMIIDTSGKHHEAFWSKYFIHSMEFLLNESK